MTQKNPIIIDQSVKVFSGADMEEFARTKFKKCPTILENFHDAFSLVEQEMCQKSHIFYYSQGSR